MRTILLFLGMAWGLELMDIVLFNQALNVCGIIPFTFSGLLGIFAAPLLHGSLLHILSNTVVFIPLSAAIVREKRGYEAITFFIVLTSGLGIWTIGQRAVHLGASGLTFGYLGYLLGEIVTRRIKSPIIVVCIPLLACLTMSQLFPGAHNVSWEGHACGFFVGILASLFRIGKESNDKRRIITTDLARESH